MKILHLEIDQYPDSAVRTLKSLGDVQSVNVTYQEDLYQLLSNQNFDIIFTRLGLEFDQKCFNLQRSLGYLVSPTSGLNHIDIDAAERAGVSVISLKGEFEFLANVRSTAEHTWALLLALVRNLVPATESTLKGYWDRNPFLSDELDGKTLGIIGYGRLGKIVANFGLAFRMNVLAYDSNENQFDDDLQLQNNKLAEVLSKSDYVLLMISYSRENVAFMDARKFMLMKEGAYFVNTSRGELINESDLIEALKSRKIKAAALDVLDGDSSWTAHRQGPNKLIEYAKQHSNLLITPHMGGYGRVSIAKTREFITNKLINSIK